MLTTRRHLTAPLFKGPYLCIKYFGIVNVKNYLGVRTYDCVLRPLGSI